MEVIEVDYGSPIPEGGDPPRYVIAFGWMGKATVIRIGPHDDLDDALRRVPHLRRMKTRERRKKVD